VNGGNNCQTALYAVEEQELALRDRIVFYRNFTIISLRRFAGSGFSNPWKMFCKKSFPSLSQLFTQSLRSEVYGLFSPLAYLVHIGAGNEGGGYEIRC
jgi:hypothetical protein